MKNQIKFIKVQQLLKSLLILGTLSLGSLFLGTACSKNVFHNETSDFSSHSEIIQDNNTSQTKVEIKYPNYAKVNNSPLQYIETELFINTLNDNKTCLVQSISKPVGSNEQLCFDAPDLCWSNNIAYVSSNLDYTCSQAFKALEISKLQPNHQCIEKTDLLSEKEKEQITNPDLYNIKLSIGEPSLLMSLEKANLSALLQNDLSQLPTLMNIKLDKSCRCNYTFASIDINSSNFKFEYPSLQEHCRSHFGEYYQ